jgi:DNA repair protein RecN (Recombination protein N)
MLTELNVKNFAIIDELGTSFGRGLNIISGETGAGKSIIVGAISLLLGDRATSDMIRSSEDAAEIEAQFNISENKIVKEKLRLLDFYEGDDLVIKRVVSRSGRNRIYINGHLATLNTLSSISESLVNICGQHEHQVIMNEENHIDILDEFGGILPLREEYKDIYNEFQSLILRLNELNTTNKKRIEKEDLIKFQLGEINTASLKPGEDSRLADEKKVITNVQKLKDCAEKAYEVMYGRSTSLLFELKNVISYIKEIKKIDEGLQLPEQELDATYYQLEDAALIIRNYIKNLSFDPVRLEIIEERLETLRKLKKKYGDTIEEILAAKVRMEMELGAISAADVEIEKIAREIALKESALMDKAEVLSKKRATVAAHLKKVVEEEIHTLKMDRAHFEVVFKKRLTEKNESLLGPKGYDSIEFYLSTNVGEEIKPLNHVASGGELSRIMLVMKKVLASTGSVGTIIFDEVDTGIGGATAEIVGQKLKDVSMNHQVLCITHLPQIACFGDRHYRVWKEIFRDRTNTCLDILTENERLDEITRMLGGVDPTKKTREHAKEMLMLSRR